MLIGDEVASESIHEAGALFQTLETAVRAHRRRSERVYQRALRRLLKSEEHPLGMRAHNAQFHLSGYSLERLLFRDD